ncbi:MAG: T9SS type A sorting domain-containing protein, partial [Rhizobacter sp.]|nr:T9SS type A sorting domain-containing protein [Chlorobiales bacterium]
FYDTTAKYMGAFGDATSPNWAEGWTNWEKTYTPPIVTSSVDKEQYSPVATNFALTQNYPNPFNPTTNITYTLQKPETVSLKVYDVLGREVETLVQSRKAAGTYTVTFNASKLTSGVYFYRLNAGGFVSSKKMMLVK